MRSAITRIRTKRRVHEDLSNKDAEHAAGRHQHDEAKGLPKVQRFACGQKLNSKEGRQKGKVPAEHISKRKPHRCGEGDPEGERMRLAGTVSLCWLGDGAN